MFALIEIYEHKSSKERKALTPSLSNFSRKSIPFLADPLVQDRP